MLFTRDLNIVIFLMLPQNMGTRIKWWQWFLLLCLITDQIFASYNFGLRWFTNHSSQIAMFHNTPTELEFENASWPCCTPHATELTSKGGGTSWDE